MMTRANDDRGDELKFLTEMIFGYNDYSTTQEKSLDTPLTYDILASRNVRYFV